MFDVILPTADVYSDLSLVIPWYWNGHYKYAASMTAPLLFQFASTVYKWFRLEKREGKKWSWPILMLQFWPQWCAIRIMHLDFRNDKKAEEKKKELMREVTTTEPFLEAWPSIIVMTIIWLLAMHDHSYYDYCRESSSSLTFSQYCEIQPQANACVVFSGPGGPTWFFVTYAVSIISGSLGITKFLQNGPFAVLTTDGLLGGIFRCKFVIAFLSVLTSMFTKGMLIGLLILAKIKTSMYHWLNEVPLITVMLIIFVTLILPNLVLSLISISFSTGLNKKLLKVIINYPASWMLPIATYFIIGPYKSNCCCKTDVNRNLGLSTFYSAINALISLIMYVSLISIWFQNGFWDFWVIPKVFYPVLVVGLVFNIIYLNIDKQCCGSNCCCQDSVVTVHLINVNHDDLQIVTIENN